MKQLESLKSSPNLSWPERMKYEWDNVVLHPTFKGQSGFLSNTQLQWYRACGETGFQPLLDATMGMSVHNQSSYIDETNWAKALNPMTWLIFAVQSLRAVTIGGLQDLHQNTANPIASFALKALDIMLDMIFTPLVFIAKVANLAIHLPADLLINSIISPVVKGVAKLFAKEKGVDDTRLKIPVNDGPSPVLENALIDSALMLNKAGNLMAQSSKRNCMENEKWGDLAGGSDSVTSDNSGQKKGVGRG